MEHGFRERARMLFLRVMIAGQLLALTGCGLRDAVTDGFFGAISDAVSTVVSGVLLPGS